MTEFEGKVLDYLATVPHGEWVSTTEVTHGAKLYTDAMDFNARRRATRSVLLDLVMKGHVNLADKSTSKEETWQQLQN